MINTKYTILCIINFVSHESHNRLSLSFAMKVANGYNSAIIWQNQAMNKCFITTWFTKNAYVIDEQGHLWFECSLLFSFAFKTKVKQQRYTSKLHLFISDMNDFFFAQTDDSFQVLGEYAFPQFFGSVYNVQLHTWYALTASAFSSSLKSRKATQQ